MIYFVDEDHRKLRALVTELEFFGYDAEIIKDADSAFTALSGVSPDDIDIVIIDVMLAVRVNGSNSRYTRERTDDYHQTGLMLLDDLAISNAEVFPNKALFFTHASNNELLSLVQKKSEEHGTIYLRKRDFNTAFEFAIKVDAIIKERRI